MYREREREIDIDRGPRKETNFSTCTRIARVNVSAGSCLHLGFSHRMHVV